MQAGVSLRSSYMVVQCIHTNIALVQATRRPQSFESLLIVVLYGVSIYIHGGKNRIVAMKRAVRVNLDMITIQTCLQV